MANYSHLLEFIPNNPQYSSITGQKGTYGNSGYFLKFNNTDYQGMFDAISNIDLADLAKNAQIQAIMTYGLYFVPSFDMWVLKTFLYEFPPDDDIKFRVKIEPVKKTNLKYPIAKTKLALDILNLLLQLILGVIKLVCSFMNNERSLGIYFMAFNLVIFVLLLVANVLYFDSYSGRDIEVGNVKFFADVNSEINLSKQIMIVCLLLQSYQTFFSLKLNSTSVYILAVIGYMQSWLWPLLVQYAVAILVFSFLVDNIVDNFNLSISDMPAAIFRLIANSNGYYWRLIINGSPTFFILVVIMVIFWIFYIVNNVYFGIQMEIVRICEIARIDFNAEEKNKKNANDEEEYEGQSIGKTRGTLKRMGFSFETMKLVKKCAAKLKARKNRSSESENENDGESPQSPSGE